MKGAFFILIVIFISISCSTEKFTEGQEIYVTSSSKLRVYYADTDLSAHYPFPSVTFLNEKEMLSYNMIRNAIDTLFFDGDSLRIKAGTFLQKDGPRKIEGITNIVNTQSGLIVFNLKNIMIDRDGSSEIENNRLVNAAVFEKDKFYSLAHGVSFYLDNLYKGYDQQKERLYFFAENFNTEEFKLIAFDLTNRDFVELPMWADVELVHANSARYNNISKNHMPYIFVHEESLVISYSYSNEFVVVNLNTYEISEMNHSSKLFPLKKTVQISIQEDLDLKSREELKRVLEILEEWDKDVVFGNFEKLPNNKGFFRMVKSPQLETSTTEQLNIEVYDSLFDKVGEINLSKNHPDLSTTFFTYGDRVFFKAIQQDQEDYLNYYFVDIDF
ncbi:hypothetical protein [Mongoliitalea daihaiensis]|uniref:hypothetical protein n=1 Tax=Mongoliitalea daihaiensis TaxID=2782006 RepID=UPI001F3497C2|nr:hypothetical protein [Mongoliitalea daihaiensis]UJP66930.1 hypothetical protein IPZ59_10215 [Mongoliitalea daihaiensis]